jgi:hypothetical protein
MHKTLDEDRKKQENTTQYVLDTTMHKTLDEDRKKQKNTTWLKGNGLLLTRKLPNQGFLLVKLKSSLRKFYGRHHDLVDRYGISDK